MLYSLAEGKLQYEGFYRKLGPREGWRHLFELFGNLLQIAKSECRQPDPDEARDWDTPNKI